MSEFIEGDAEDLAFPDASFDAVLSIYGVMFAPTTSGPRPSWPGSAVPAAGSRWRAGLPTASSARPSGSSRATSPRARACSRLSAGAMKAYLDSLFGHVAASIVSHRRTAVFRFRSAEENVDFFRTYYGPTLRAFESLDPPRRESFRDDLIALARRYDRNKRRGADRHRRRLPRDRDRPGVTAGPESRTPRSESSASSKP